MYNVATFHTVQVQEHILATTGSITSHLDVLSPNTVP